MKLQPQVNALDEVLAESNTEMGHPDLIGIRRCWVCAATIFLTHPNFSGNFVKKMFLKLKII